MALLALVVLAGLPSTDSSAGLTVRGIVLLAFWLLAPGGAVVVHLRLTPLTKIAVVPLLGLGALVVTSLIGAWVGPWVPRLSAALVAVLALVSVGVPLLRGAMQRRPVLEPRLTRSTVALAAGLLVCLGLWVLALPQTRSAQSSVFGLLVAGPRLLPASLLGIAVVFLIALRQGRTAVTVAAAGAFILVLRCTATLASTVPGPAWAYKHIGVVEVLLDQHHVLSGTDIYMNWPGMFTASAYLSASSGVPVLDLARWMTPLVHVLLALQVAALARVLGARPAGAAAAAVLVVVFNWVGQDYFSPQALALCLAGGVLVCLAQSRASRACAVLSLVLFAVVVPTHQLTPFWLLGLAAVLAVLRRAPWWVPVAMAVVLVGFVVPRYDVVAAYGIFSGFDPIANAANNVPGVSARGSQVGSLFARVTALLMWFTTMLVLLVRTRRVGWRRAWREDAIVVPAVLAFSPLLLLGGQSYGGEAINRVILYSCLGCAAVLGPALARAVTGRRLVLAAATVWTVVVVAVAAQSSFGQWSGNLIRSEDVAAARWLAAEAPDATVIPVVFNWPGRVWLDYPRYFGYDAEADASLDGLAPIAIAAAGEPVSANAFPMTLTRLEEIVQARPSVATYVVFTGSMRARDAYYATFAPGAYQSLLSGLQGSPNWRAVRHEGDLWVFQYAPVG